METQIQITCFAGLRKYFEPEMNITIKLPCSYHSIIQELKKMNPEAEEILNNCRIAVNEKFVPHSDLKITDEPIFLIPPSSGG